MSSTAGLKLSALSLGPYFEMVAKSLVARILTHLILISGGALFLLPLGWMFLTSVKPISQATQIPPHLFPYPERLKGLDGQLHPAAYYLPPGEEDEKVVAVLSRGTDTARIEVGLPGGRKEVRVVPAAEIRVPGAWRWDNYVRAISYKRDELGYIPFLRYGKNTLYIALLSVLGTVIANSLIAYGFSRIRWPGRDIAFALTIATMMIPAPVLMVPKYILFKALGWVGSPKPLWVPEWFGSAFNIFLLRQFFMSLPFELSDAAKIDGCSEFRVYRDVILPLAKPALAVVALFNFMFVWNDFMGPLIYLTDQRSYTLAYGLQAYQSQHGGTQWHLLMAAATVVVAPVILVFFLAQRTFIQGITVTGIKG
jgi:multiple sugar transport system permease protein